jgi:hypothetical protein
LSGSITRLGTETSKIDSVTFNEGTNQTNYNIEYEEGTLTINSRVSKDGDDAPYTIKVLASSDSVQYDGTEKICEGFVITDAEYYDLTSKNTDETNVEGYRFTVSFNGTDYVDYFIEVSARGSGTEPSVYPVSVSDKKDIVIRDEEGTDVTDQFEIETEDGTLTITKASSSSSGTGYIPSTTPSNTTIVDTVDTDTVDTVGDSNTESTEDDTISDNDDDEELDDVTIKKVNSSNSSDSDNNTSTTGTNKNSRKRSGNLPSTGEPIDLLIWVILGVTCSAATVLLIYFAICGIRRLLR